MSFFQAAWPQYEIARAWLALPRRLPWRLMTFLADAHRRGVLRQAGAVYQFRHIELQQRLANRNTGKQQDDARQRYLLPQVRMQRPNAGKPAA